MSRRPIDEDDLRIKRAGSTRPRSKVRPGHAAARGGMVTIIDRGRITCYLPDSGATVVAVKARELGRKPVAVGDRVALVGDVSGAPDALARLVRIEPRGTTLRRTADDDDPYERVIVANADQLGVVVALADPPPRTGLIDRCLVAAYDGGLTPLLILTKPDLASPDDLLRSYAALDVPAVAVHRGGDLSALRSQLAGRVTVLVGHSGVGKSTLVNALVADADRTTAAVNAVTGRGKHTSTSAEALALAGGGWIIDTPGVRSFGLAHVDVDRVAGAFADLAAGTGDCPRSCSHDEPECALDQWVADGHSSPQRLASLRRILRSRAEG